jgi:hypothetical protein
MWVLNAKFGCKLEVLKGLAMQHLRGLKLADGSGLPQHLDKLTTLCADYTRVGGCILDPEMNSIIIQLLPILEFHGDVMRLGRLTVTFEMESELLTYWEQVYGETAGGRAVIVNVLAATAKTSSARTAPWLVTPRIIAGRVEEGKKDMHRVDGARRLDLSLGSTLLKRLELRKPLSGM